MNTLIWIMAAHLVTTSPAMSEAKNPHVETQASVQAASEIKAGKNTVNNGGRLFNADKNQGKPIPTNSILRTIAWQATKEDDAGITDLKEVLKSHPKDPSLFIYRGVFWHYKQEYDKAIDEYNEALKLDPNNAEAILNRGLARCYKHQIDEALSDLSESIKIDQSNALAYFNRGLIWTDKKEYDKAINDFNKALRIDPKEESFYHARGMAYHFKKEYDKAINDYTKSIRIDPESSSAYSNRGQLFYYQHEYAKALGDYNQSIRIDPKDAFTYHARAWLWATCPDEKFRDGKQAIESATRACELADWKDGDYLASLAAAYAELGEFDKAVEWQEKAIKLYAEKDKTDFKTMLEEFKNKKPHRN